MEEEKQKLPEFILIDESEGQDPLSGGFENLNFEDVEVLKEKSFPLWLRIASGFCSLVFLFAMFLLLVGSALFGSLVLITLGKIPALIDLTQMVWGFTKKMAVFFLGLFTAFFSPVLGFSMILLYFVLQGEKVEAGLFERLFRTHSPL